MNLIESNNAHHAIVSMMDAYYSARRNGADSVKLNTVECLIERLDMFHDIACETGADDDFIKVANEARAIRAYILNIKEAA